MSPVVSARYLRFAIALSLFTFHVSRLSAQTEKEPFPKLPDSTGFGTHVLAVARDPQGTLWVGTYGDGIYRLKPGAGQVWEHLRHDSTESSISWDFIHAFAFGQRGEVWYGTVGNGWGLSTDGGTTWKNWTFKQLGPEWQYLASDGIVIRGDSVFVGTADGIQLTTDNGQHWVALVDGTGPAGKGPADTSIVVLTNEYIRRIGLDRRGVLVTTLRGNSRLVNGPTGWVSEPVASAAFSPRNRILIAGRSWKGTGCGLKPLADTLPCIRKVGGAAGTPQNPKTTWFRRPIALTDNSYIDQTYRYGSTMGGNFQQHQGVEFNNPDGTQVTAIAGGKVVYAGPAEQGALTVAIRHDTTVAGAKGPLRVFSVYYHNSELKVKVGQTVRAGQVISLVGNTGRATNDHMHLEVHAAPSEDVKFIVDSLERFPQYTTNPELWIEPLPNTGIVAGVVLDAAGQPVPQARVYGIVKPEPVETPFSYAETYGDKAHSHPLYNENFAVGDVPIGTYNLGVEIGGKRVTRSVTVEAGKVTWVTLKP